MKLRSPDGRWIVEKIRLADSGDWFRVSQWGFYEAQVRTLAELAKFGIKVDDLEEAE